MNEEKIIERLKRIEREVERLRVKEKQVFVPLTTPLTSTSWDGDAYSSTSGKVLIDLSTVFGVPAGIKAIILEANFKDSGSETGTANDGPWLVFSGENTDSWQGAGVNIRGVPNDHYRNAHFIVACNDDGDIYYRLNASGTDTANIILKIWGYWL